MAKPMKGRDTNPFSIYVYTNQAFKTLIIEVSARQRTKDGLPMSQSEFANLAMLEKIKKISRKDPEVKRLLDQYLATPVDEN
jgi:hypothetical protein